MAIVRSDIPRLLEAGLRAVFFDAYEAAPVNWEQIATVVPSEHDTGEVRMARRSAEDAGVQG